MSECMACEGTPKAPNIPCAVCGCAACSTDPLVFTYRNWRGEVGERRVRPVGVTFGATEWHPEPQWLLNAVDLDKDALRSFAMRDITFARASSPSDGIAPPRSSIDVQAEMRAETTANPCEWCHGAGKVSHRDYHDVQSTGTCDRCGGCGFEDPRGTIATLLADNARLQSELAAMQADRDAAALSLEAVQAGLTTLDKAIGAYGVHPFVREVFSMLLKTTDHVVARQEMQA